MACSSTEQDHIVKLNIGGVKYWTTVDTLTKTNQEGTFFYSLLSSKYKVVKDEKGFIFIDRDGKLFEPILSYLRTGRWRVPPYLDSQSVLEEAEYYGIKPNMYAFAKTLGELSNDSIRLCQEEIVLREKEAVYNANRIVLDQLKDIVLNSFTTCLQNKLPLETPRIFKSSSEIILDISSYLPGFVRGLQTDKEIVYKQLLNGSPNAIFDTSIHQLLQTKTICEVFIDHLQREYNLSVRISCTRCEWNKLIQNINYYPVQSVSDLQGLGQGLCNFYVLSWFHNTK